MTLSDVFYHTKPFLLLGGGIFAILNGPNGVAVVGGLLLCGAGGWIWKLRNR